MPWSRRVTNKQVERDEAVLQLERTAILRPSENRNSPQDHGGKRSEAQYYGRKNTQQRRVGVAELSFSMNFLMSIRR